MASSTYHTVFIPPTLRFTSNDDAVRYATDTARMLTTARSILNDKAPLDVPDGCNPNHHLILVVSTEFGYNRYPSEGKYLTDASHPVRFDYFQAALKTLHQAINALKDRTIVIAISAVVDYGFGPDSNKLVFMAENAVFVINNESGGFQKISKWTKSNRDNWNNEQNLVDGENGWKDKDEKGKVKEYYDWSKRHEGDRNNPERMSEHTHVVKKFRRDIKDMNTNLSIGFGLCLDSKYEKYPGTQLVCFLGCDMTSTTVEYKDLGGYVLSDALQKRGERSFRQPDWDRTHWDPIFQRYRDDVKRENERFVRDYPDVRFPGKSSTITDAELDDMKRKPPTYQQAQRVQSLTEVKNLVSPGAVPLRPGIWWPLTIDEGGVFYQQQNYKTLDGGVVYGAAQQIPKEPVPSDPKDPVVGSKQPTIRAYLDEGDMRGVWVTEVEDRAGKKKTISLPALVKLFKQASDDAKLKKNMEFQGFDWTAYLSRALNGLLPGFDKETLWS